MLSHFLRTVAADDDPNFRNVTLLLPGNGTNGAQNNTFLDSSTNNFTVTRNGNPTQGTFTPYGPNWSNYFDGNGDYLTVPDSSVYATGTNNFTLECWIYPTQNSSAVAARIISQQGPAGYWALRQETNTIAYFYLNASTSATVSLNSGAVITPNLWYHLAVVRNGNSFTLYVNGISVATGTSSGAIPDVARVVAIGAYFETSASEYFAGNISNLRLVTGASAALYTANFTPPTAPLTAITGTVLLTCQSNRFIDNSSNNFTVTRNGDVSVQRFSPFNPTGPYESTVIGGSGYFDKNGDYLTVADNAAFEFGSGNFTVEAWIYLTGYSINWSGTGNYAASILGKDSITSRGFHFIITGSATSWTNISCLLFSSNTVFTTTSAAFTFALNTWYHVAWVRNGTSLRIYVNGVDVGGGTNSVNIQNSTVNVSVGSLLYTGYEYYFPGYMTDLRVIKGTAQYTANFTPPSAPLTAVTNTQLLLNYTNAGIIDNAMMNDLETVGNAQISTAQSVFGGSSMLFDGTGDVVAVPYTTAGAMNLLKPWGSGSYTLECWLRFNSVASGQHMFVGYTNATATFDFAIYIASTGSLNYYLSSTGTTWNLAAGVSVGAIATNQWYHFAFVKNGNTWTPYLNGIAGTSTTTATTIIENALPFSVGGVIGSGAGSATNGYIDDVRVTKGIARYTANFTPPVRPYPTR